MKFGQSKVQRMYLNVDLDAKVKGTLRVSKYYYVGADNDGTEDPDCWLASIRDSGATIVWSGNPNLPGTSSWQSWCASESIKYLGIPLTNIEYVSYSDTGQNVPFPPDATSDKLKVNVLVAISGNEITNYGG